MNLSRERLRCVLILLCTIIFISLTVEDIYAQRYFFIERPRLGLGLSYEFEEDKRTGPNINREDTTTTFSEKFEIETEGWVYHPALMIYTLRLLPEWEQISEESEGSGKTSTKAFLQGYFTEFTFLQYKPYTLRIFANKQMGTVRSSLAQRTKTETDSYGGTLMLKYKLLPTTLNYIHTTSHESGFFSAQGKADEFRLNTRYDKKFGDTRLDASYIDNTRTTQGIPINISAENVTVQNYYNITKDKRVALSSGFNYRSAKSNFIESTVYGLSESLQWRHKENLSTNYLLRYDKSSTEAFSAESKAAGFGLTHLLYENLTTSINADAALSEFTGGEIASYGTGLSFNYTRRIPWGNLNINIGHDYRVVMQDYVQDFIQVLDESITLTDGVVISLNLWSAWRTYYRFNHSQQNFLSGIRPERLTDDTTHTAGTELEWKWSRTNLEFEDRQTTTAPLTRWRAEEIITLKPMEKLFLSLSGNYSETEFKDTGDKETFNGFRGTAQIVVSHWGWLKLEGFRNSLSGKSQKTTDSGFLSVFDMFFGIWRASISYRFLQEKDETSQETFQNNYFLFEIKRTLF
ncbi:MAG: hypothetical protein HY756_07480 [Nitrospirae bacterium]|nr:hypothetical protein [Nitrospirota bacterium]